MKIIGCEIVEWFALRQDWLSDSGGKISGGCVEQWGSCITVMVAAF